MKTEQAEFLWEKRVKSSIRRTCLSLHFNEAESAVLMRYVVGLRGIELQATERLFSVLDTIYQESLKRPRLR